MTEQIITRCHERRQSSPVVGVVQFCLPFSAIVAACFICFFSKMPIQIEYPAILAVASIIVLLPFKSEAANALQKIIAFYLIAVPVNQLSSQYFQISILPVDINVSFSVLVLALCAMGYLVGRPGSTNPLPDAISTGILSGWVLALAMVIAFMIVLALLLSAFYGYGYERNLSVIGNLCLYFLLFIFLWEKLRRLRFRQAAGLILTVFYFAVMVTKR